MPLENALGNLLGEPGIKQMCLFALGNLLGEPGIKQMCLFNRQILTC